MVGLADNLILRGCRAKCKFNLMGGGCKKKVLSKTPLFWNRPNMKNLTNQVKKIQVENVKFLFVLRFYGS